MCYHGIEMVTLNKHQETSVISVFYDNYHHTYDLDDSFT